MTRQAAALEAHENDQEVTGDKRDSAVRAANVWRSDRGIPPLNEHEEHTEQKLHELARARGLLRRIR
jgi:hypothetical protein